MLQIILDVMVILPYPPQLKEGHKDSCVLVQTVKWADLKYFLLSQSTCTISSQKYSNNEIEKAASTLCDPRAAVARFTSISCLHLNGDAIPGVIQQQEL